MKLSPRLADRLFDCPLMLDPPAAAILAETIHERVQAHLKTPAVEAGRLLGDLPRAKASGKRLYPVRDGVAVIEVFGDLVNRGAWLGMRNGYTSYEGLAAQIEAAAADAEVRGVLLDIDSQGGEAAGAMETAALVRKASEKKPVVAFVNGVALSAAYAIAAGAPRVVVTPSAMVGSIGVVAMHLDRSEAIARAGLRPTLIYAGARKVDGSSLKPLDPQTHGRLQERVDDLYNLFVATVAGLRNLSEAAVRETEAALFMGARAVKTGLADAIGDKESAIASLSPNAAKTPPATISRADLVDRVRRGGPRAATPDREAERSRLEAIMTSKAVEGRRQFALHLAFETDLDPQTALALLAATPAEPKAPATPIHRPRLVGVPRESDAAAAGLRGKGRAPGS